MKGIDNCFPESVESIVFQIFLCIHYVFSNEIFISNMVEIRRNSKPEFLLASELQIGE